MLIKVTEIEAFLSASDWKGLQKLIFWTFSFLVEKSSEYLQNCVTGIAPHAFHRCSDHSEQSILSRWSAICRWLRMSQCVSSVSCLLISRPVSSHIGGSIRRIFGKVAKFEYNVSGSKVLTCGQTSKLCFWWHQIHVPMRLDVRNTTAFLVCRYLCWIKVIRDEHFHEKRSIFIKAYGIPINC